MQKLHRSVYTLLPVPMAMQCCCFFAPLHSTRSIHDHFSHIFQKCASIKNRFYHRLCWIVTNALFITIYYGQKCNLTERVLNCLRHVTRKINCINRTLIAFNGNVVTLNGLLIWIRFVCDWNWWWSFVTCTFFSYFQSSLN